VHPSCIEHVVDVYCDEQLSATPPQVLFHVQPVAMAQSLSLSKLHGVGVPLHRGTPDPGPVFSHHPNSLHVVPEGQS
jgi:hypothetical protein